MALGIAKAIFGGGKKKAATQAATTDTNNAPQPVVTPLSPDDARRAQRRPVRNLFNPAPSSSILSNTLGG